MCNFNFNAVYDNNGGNGFVRPIVALRNKNFKLFMKKIN